MSQFIHSSQEPLKSDVRSQTSHHSQEMVFHHKTVTAEAHGKAILVGEHAVVYGARATAFPVKSVGMNIQLTPAKALFRGTEQAVSIKASLSGRGISDHLKSLIFEAFEVLKIKPFSLEIEGFSTGLVGAGMGSSATLCVVILKAIAASVGLTMTCSQIAESANLLERHFHGQPSGLDTAVVAFESPLCFKKGEAPVLIKARPLEEAEELQWPFVLLDSSTRSSTIAMVKGVSPYFLSPSEGHKRILRFDHLAMVSKEGLEEGDLHKVAFSMNEASHLLKEAGASSVALDDMIEMARGLGCLAAKPTGAGGGGCVLVLLDPEHQKVQHARLKEKLGAPRVITVNRGQEASTPEILA